MRVLGLRRAIGTRRVGFKIVFEVRFGGFLKAPRSNFSGVAIVLDPVFRVASELNLRTTSVPFSGTFEAKLPKFSFQSARRVETPTQKATRCPTLAGQQPKQVLT